MISKFKKGFSLIELLVVIAIIGILAAVGITAYSGYTSSAKEKSTIANHSQVVSLINSELAKCAAGEGDYVWGSAAVEAQDAVLNDDGEVTTPAVLQADFDADPCFEAPVEAHIVLHVNGVGSGQLGMVNSYNADLSFSVAGAQNATVTVLGQSNIWCGTKGQGCQVRTLSDTGTHEEKNITAY